MEEEKKTLDLGIVPVEQMARGGEGHSCFLVCNICGSGAIKVPIGS